MSNTPDVIRWLLSALLTYGVYTETGPWTALFAGLLFVRWEIKSMVRVFKYRVVQEDAK